MITMISVIIPVFNEGPLVGDTISRVFYVADQSGVSPEVIVVDGHPERTTLKYIEDERVITMGSARGRANQMNAGAAASRGSVLLFLHADTILPDRAFASIDDALDTSGAVGGAFELAIDSRHPFLILTALYASLRCRVTRIPYGDQAIFMSRDYFQLIGGYRPIPLMEDVELMREVKRRGKEIAIIPDKVITSARRWEKEGIYRGFVRNKVLITLHYLGMSPEKLAEFYRPQRK